jgi:quercetin dioxygenase-like cupin family protein
VSINKASAEQVSYVAAGRVRYFLGEEQADLETGNLVTIPAGTPHRIQLLSPTVRLVDAFHPVREDFL